MHEQAFVLIGILWRIDQHLPLKSWQQTHFWTSCFTMDTVWQSRISMSYGRQKLYSLNMSVISLQVNMIAGVIVLVISVHGSINDPSHAESHYGVCLQL